jgi:acyl carrier protein
MSNSVDSLELQDIMRDIFDDDELIISNDTTAEDVDDWDSLTHISLVIAIEKKWSIKFSHGEIEEVKNVGEFLNLLNKKII